jgi:glucose/arabinose dehydrogenase
MIAAIAVPRLASAVACNGDCDNNREVTVDELVTGVGIALGSLAVSACASMDVDADGTVTVDELIRAVNFALSGCPAEATATFTESPTETATATPSPSETPSPTPSPTDSPTPAATATETATQPVQFCDLPGSVRYLEDRIDVVPGGPASASDLRFMQLPVGFCAHFYARVGNPRALRFAPGGELFVASPTTGTTGGGVGGQAAILVLPDDNRDGVADTSSTFLGQIPSTQGMMFINGYFYYQNGTKIMRVPYSAGDRTPAHGSEMVADITIHKSSLHWPKPIDIADDGTIYVGNGGDQGDPCQPTRPFLGGILMLDGSPGGTIAAKGFRNPIALRCSRGHNLCFAIELAKDFTASQGGREKLVPIRQSGDWGFPCCATKDTPYRDIQPVPDCSDVMGENAAFFIGDTPFDLDFETGKWPAPWNNRVYVPLHGAYGTWKGARVVAIEMDPVTGDVLPGHDLIEHMSTGAMADFATGYDDQTLAHGRPANVAFAPDGRLFLGNDEGGVIIWIAPFGL